MGSSKPSNLEMPFGYFIDNTSTSYPFPSPTAPAPGPSLLDDNESKFLDSFFDGVSSDQFNYDFFNNAPDGSELGLGWNELPPTFMGTQTSFGQQPQMGSHGMADTNYSRMNSQLNPGHTIPPSTSADVLAAATLLQSGSIGRSYSMADESSMKNKHTQMLTGNGPPRAQSMSQSGSRLPQGLHPSATEDLMKYNLSDAVFGAQPEASGRYARLGQKVEVQWGSDAAFGTSQGFMAPPGPDNVTANEKYHIHNVENALSIGAAQMLSSPNSTRPSSPVALETQDQEVKHEDEEQDARPRKRRKSKHAGDDNDEDEELPSPASAPHKPSGKKRKSTKKESDAGAAEPEVSHRRKKSTAAAAAAAAASTKAARENLTEDQKRENHIKSEQKRRHLIREGFEDLGELVPGLRGGGFSKSAVLVMAADWLEDLIAGNEVLRGRLEGMEGGRGSDT